MPSPAPVNSVLMAFTRSRVLISAVEIDLFTSLAEAPATEEELRARLNLHPRFSRDFFDALVALGMLEIRDGRYHNSAITDHYLDRAKSTYIGGFFEVTGRRFWSAFGRLTTALRTGEAQIKLPPDDGDHLFRTSVTDDPDRVRRFMTAMESHAVRMGEEIAQRIDWSGYTTLVDLGGARGGLAATIAKAHPHVRATCFDRPPARRFFDEFADSAGLGERLRFQAGDFFADPLPPADVLVYGHVLHDWDPQARITLIRRAREALRPGGTLVVYDRMIDEDLGDPEQLMFSIMVMLTSAGGSEYRVADCRQWLTDAGFTDVRAESVLEDHTLVLAR